MPHTLHTSADVVHALCIVLRARPFAAVLEKTQETRDHRCIELKDPTGTTLERFLFLNGICIYSYTSDSNDRTKGIRRRVTIT